MTEIEVILESIKELMPLAVAKERYEIGNRIVEKNKIINYDVANKIDQLASLLIYKIDKRILRDKP